MSVDFGNNLQAIQSITTVFASLEISYRIAGSVASSALGVMRSTLDIDIVANIHTEQVSSFIHLLREDFFVDEEFVSDAVRSGCSFNLIHRKTFLKVDIFPVKQRMYDQTAFRRKHVDQLGENPPLLVNFLTPEDVLLSKLEWFELGERTSEQQWGDILGVLRIQAENLDFTYLHYWAEQLGVKELLEQALQESKA
jgi:hypothetical protein